MFNLNLDDITPIELCCKILQISGTMDFRGKPLRLLTFASLVFLNGCFAFFNGILFYNGNLYVIDIVEGLAVCFAVFHIAGKLFTLFTYEAEIRQLLARIEEVRQSVLKEAKYKEGLIKKERFINKLLIFLNTSYITFPFFSTLFNFANNYFSGKEIPDIIVKIALPWDYTKSWSYMLSMIFVCIIVLAVVDAVALFYTLIITLSFELSILLEILQDKLEYNDGSKDVNTYKMYASIIHITRDYNYYLSGQIYLDVLLSSFQPCGYSYVIMKTVKAGDQRLVDYIYKFFLSIFPSFLLCSCGQEFSTQIEKLHESSYMGGWYEEKPQDRRDILVLMTVTNRPTKITYRGFVTINLMCFATVMQGLYSYLTMISNFALLD